MEQQIINIGEMIKEYKRALSNVWDYITKLPQWGNPCKCENKDTDDEFDTIDYTGDIPNVCQWCINCGGYRE